MSLNLPAGGARVDGAEWRGEAAAGGGEHDDGVLKQVALCPGLGVVIPPDGGHDAPHRVVQVADGGQVAPPHGVRLVGVHLLEPLLGVQRQLQVVEVEEDEEGVGGVAGGDVHLAGGVACEEAPLDVEVLVEQLLKP